MAWTRWNAPSDRDYDEQYYDRSRGIERTCTDCGAPVMVDRGEVYQVQVFCRDCIERSERRRMAVVQAARKSETDAA